MSKTYRRKNSNPGKDGDDWYYQMYHTDNMGSAKFDPVWEKEQNMKFRKKQNMELKKELIIVGYDGNYYTRPNKVA